MAYKDRIADGLPGQWPLGSGEIALPPMDGRQSEMTPRPYYGVSSNPLQREIFGGAVSGPPGLAHRPPPAAGAETGPPPGKQAEQRMFDDTP